MINLSIEQAETFACYSTDKLHESLYVPPVSWRLRNEINDNTDATSVEIQQMFRAFASEMHHATFIYTDGSRSEAGTGAAAYICDTKKCQRTIHCLQR